MGAGAIIGGIAIEVAKEAIEWAVDKVKSRAKEKLGDVVDAIDPRVIEALVTAQMQLLAQATQSVVDEFDAAEARGRAKPLGGGAIEFVECCACASTTFVDGICERCGKPEFTKE